MSEATHKVFITGGTGYIGGQLIPALLLRGHSVRALVRPESEARVPLGCRAVIGNALDAESFKDKIDGADTLVHLVGVPHPNPSKAMQFRSIDLASARASLAAALHAAVKHFVYLSVAQPAPTMHAYVAARAEAEALIRGSGIGTTVLRPWYVLGPGHRWPYLLMPCYWLMERLPSTRETAMRMGLVHLEQIVAAIVNAVERPERGVRIVEVPEIRSAGRR